MQSLTTNSTSNIQFVWNHGGSTVSLVGSFTDWQPVPMHKKQQQQGGEPCDTWTLIHGLPYGTHQYKFVVDNKWCYDITKPNEDDGSGNVNNIIDIYGSKAVADLSSPHYRVYFVRNGLPVSPFHDIPLWVDKEKGIANMVVEIPKGSRPKLEISKGDALNPIKQDVKNGKLRFVHDPYPFNYGAFPQTWENPSFHDERTNAKGDNDPVDVCDISSTVKSTGTVIQVKILGTYAMLDAGETDWKIIVIDVTDENAELYNSPEDVPQEKLNEVFSFLRDYKIPDGNPPNQFAFNNEIKDKKFALDICNETHEEWVKLIQGKITRPEIQLATTVYRCATIISQEDAEHAIAEQQQKFDTDL